MPRRAKEKSALEVKRLTQPGFHAVGGVSGLYLQVVPSGGRSWILRTTVGAKRRDIGLGGYPSVTLQQARDKARAVRDQIREGIDPVAERRKARDSLIAAQANMLTFEQAARHCHKAKAPEFRNTKHREDWIGSLERYAFPTIGRLPVADIELSHVMAILEPIWTSKTETATRVRQRLEAVLTWAKVGGYRSGENPARWDGNLREILPNPSKVRKVKHFRALPWQEVGAFMAELREREGVSVRALEFAILTAARSGEVRKATWDEFDLGNQLWTVPGDRIKAGKTHRVPLSEPAAEIIKNLPKLSDTYVFAAPRGGPLSDMALSQVCRRMGVDAVPHGFRSSFKDWARNRTNYADEISELALAHVNSDATRAAYARDELLPQRTRLMADWARYCGVSENQGNVVQMAQTN